MTQQPMRICILGGGFGGLYTALRLAELPWLKTERPEIMLVDQGDRFVFAPLLYELMTGELQSWEVAPPYTELLAATSVRFHQGTVTGIDLETSQVHLQAGETLGYDRLVLALGGTTPMDLVPGVADHALPFRHLADAYRLEERLRHLEQSEAEKLRVAIVGAGPSGVELACKLADRLGERGRLRLIEQGDQILRSSTDFNRAMATKSLEARGIWLDLETTVDSVTAETITLGYKGQVDTIPVDLVLWTVGTKMHPAIVALPLKQNSRQQLLTDPTLQVLDHPHIFALGDLADGQDITGRKVAATAQAAFQQADYVAWNLWAGLTDRPLLPFRYYHQGEMLTLGIDHATLTGFDLQLEGMPAQWIRRLVYLSRMPTLDHQLKVGLNWMVRPWQSLLAALT